MQLVLTPELLLEAYAQGLFPMAYNAQSPYVHWICPEERGQLSITEMHIPRRLLKTVRNAPYDIKINADFEGVIRGCAEARSDRPETWINGSIMKAFMQLHQKGFAHSVECWHGGKLVGGLYGLALGSAFFGESMFSRSRDASKIALVHLAARLWKGGFTLLDTQFVNDHLKQFGVYEIPYKQYKIRLKNALEKDADFLLHGTDLDEAQLIQAYLEMREALKS